MAVPSVIRMSNVTVVAATVEATPQTATLTSQVDKFELTVKKTVKTRTTFGNTWDQVGTGLNSGTGTLELFLNYDATGVNLFFNRVFFTTSGAFTLIVTDSVSGKGYSFAAVLPAWTPLSGGTDDDAKSTITFTVNGTVTVV